MVFVFIMITDKKLFFKFDSIYLEWKPEDTRLGGKVEIILEGASFRSDDNPVENEIDGRNIIFFCDKM